MVTILYLSPVEHLWDVVEQEVCFIDVQQTNLQQLYDVIMSVWTNISVECFQHLLNLYAMKNCRAVHRVILTYASLDIQESVYMCTAVS